MNWDEYENFTEDEFRCQCGCGETNMDPDFMYSLQSLRRSYGKGMTVTSGYRCPEHNNRVSSTGLGGPHTTGKAADIAVQRGDAYELLKLAVLHPFTGYGINQKGHGRFIHLDTLRVKEGHPRPTVWSY